MTVLTHLRAIEDVARYGFRGAVRETVRVTEMNETKSHIIVPGEIGAWAEKKYVPPVATVVNDQAVYEPWEPINEFQLTEAGRREFKLKLI